jgi:hypothetical protein
MEYVGVRWRRVYPNPRKIGDARLAPRRLALEASAGAGKLICPDHPALAVQVSTLSVSRPATLHGEKGPSTDTFEPGRTRG